VIITAIIHYIDQLSIFLLLSLIILHILHLNGPYKLPLSSFFRPFTRYEHFFMRLLFKILKTEWLYRNRLIRAIPEFVSYIAANGVRPAVYTLQQLEHAVNSIYQKNPPPQFGVVLRPCPCRDAQGKYSKTLPNVTDVILTTNVKSLKKSPNNVFITKHQLIQKLRQFDEAGLVHIVLGCCGEEGFGIGICNCHKSVCFVLLAYLGRGIKRGIAPGPSIATCDSNLCKGIDACGKCLTRCIFHARSAKDGKGLVISERCLGCGLCSNTCESGATRMAPRKNPKELYFPLNCL
jgi:Pyruvate/2-oxoacid:ferredoxin oxidoreductase delta subunit